MLSVVQDGETPLQLAKNYNKHETLKFLESYLQEVRTYIIIQRVDNVAN